MIPEEQRDFRSNRYNNSYPQRDFTGHPSSTATQVIVFRDPVH